MGVLRVFLNPQKLQCGEFSHSTCCRFELGQIASFLCKKAHYLQHTEMGFFIFFMCCMCESDKFSIPVAFQMQVIYT